MKKVFILTSFVILFIVLPWVAVADDLKEAQKHVRNLDAAVNVTLDRVEGLETQTKKHVTNLDTSVNALAGRVEKVEQGTKPAPGPVIDSQARQIGNRGLAWVVRLSFITSTGNYPEIEEVEAMLSPIERGNMSPKSFENAVFAAIKAKGWTYLERPPTGLGEQKVREIADAAAKEKADKAAAKALEDAKTYTDQKAQATVASLKKIEDGIASLRKDLEGTASLQSQLANKADKAAFEDFRGKVLDEKGEPKFASAKEFTGLKDCIIDKDGKLKLAKTETVETVFCTLDGRITPLEAGAKRTEARVSALEAAATYLSQKKWDEAKGAMFIHYGRDGLRALGWSEKEIDKAEKAAGKLTVSPKPVETEVPQSAEGGAEEAY